MQQSLDDKKEKLEDNKGVLSNLPSEVDVNCFEEKGYFISEQIIPTELIEEAMHGVARHYDGERDYLLPLTGGFLDWRREHGEGLRINDYVSLQNEQLRNLAHWPLIAAFAGRLSRVHGIRLFHDQLITKSPSLEKNTTIGWHIDQAYWKSCSSKNMITAWIPLMPYTIEMGPITYLEGSHKWPSLGWMSTFNENDLSALESKFKNANRTIQKKTIEISPGQVCFHHSNIIHGSYPNKGTSPRVALTLHFQDTHNHYQRILKPDGYPFLHINDLLCRSLSNGDPDYADPEICPLLWEENWITDNDK